jgi:hypothetical protein
MFTVTQSIFFVNSQTNSSALILIILYAVLINVAMLAALYIKCISNINEGSFATRLISGAGLTRINMAVLVILTIILKSSKLVCTSAMFGHLTISRTAVWMSAITLLAFYGVVSILLKSKLVAGVGAIELCIHGLLLALSAALL